MLISRHLLAAAALLFAAHAAAAPAKVWCAFDEQGLASLTSDGHQFLKKGTPTILNIFFADDKGASVPADASQPTVSFESGAQRLSYSWPWGAMRFRYALAGARLNIDLTIENDTAGPLSGVEFDLLTLQFPRRPVGEGWERRFEMMGDNDGDVTALGADYGKGMLTFCIDETGPLVRAGFYPGAQPPQETWSLRVTSPIGYHTPRVFVGPRNARTFRFSLRFSESGAPLKAVAGDLIEKFVAAHPFQLKWPDRRPIGMLMLSSTSHSSPSNPRGWFHDKQADFRGEKGVARFREAALETADRSIRILQDMGAQGMIFWDMEGEEFANITFVGDPRMTAKLAPEMAAVAPEFFARFIKAGLRTGVCIRPSHIVPGWDGKSKWQHSQGGIDITEDMIEKIAYAKKHLGCLLYYVDTNVRWYAKPDGTMDSLLLEGAAFKRMAEAHPDVLIIPEIPRLAYWSCTAPFQDLRPHMFGHHAATDARVLDFYPKAFSVINPTDGPAEERRAEIVAGQRRGDILLFPCWFEHAQNKLFKGILKDASRQK